MWYRGPLKVLNGTKLTRGITWSHLESVWNHSGPSDVCMLWQYRLWSFQTRGTKLERLLPKNQHTQRKLLNLENLISGGLGSFQKSEF